MAARITIDQLAQWLRGQDDIALIGHVNPDGDATGSCLAIALALKAMDKKCVVCLPGGMPKMYSCLPGAEMVVPAGAEMPFEPKAALAVDTSEIERMGAEGMRVFEGCENRAALDHHETNAGFGQFYCLDGKAAATGEMAVELIRSLNVELTAEMARCLYVAISTDCGQFQFSNTRGDTLRAAAACVDSGADTEDITRRLYRTRTPGRTRLLAAVLSGLEISPDGKMAWARLTEDMLARAGAIREDNEGIVNYLLEIEGVVFAALAEQRGDKTKFSLRSVAPVNVAKDVALPLGGGGHDRAAGVTLDTDMETALSSVLDLARKAIDRG